MPDLTTISAEEFEDLLENIAGESKPYGIILQPVLLIVQATEQGGTIWIGEGSVLVTDSAEKPPIPENSGHQK